MIFGAVQVVTSAALFVSVIRALVAPAFSENCRAIENPENLAPHLPSGKAQRLHFQVIAAATPPPTFHLDST